MTFIDLIRSRRSVRQYAARPVEPDKVDLLVEAALRAMSSRSLRPWEFVVVTQPETISKLALAKTHGSSFLKGAPLALVICGNPARSDVWVEDTSIAATFVHLAAADMGLGSCWIQIRLRAHSDSLTSTDYVASVLGLPEGLQVEAILAVGYPAETSGPRPAAPLDDDKVSYEHYGQKGQS